MTAIGVFDSGIGGLTVLRALSKALPEEQFIYLGDTARLPYGTKSKETIYAYLEQNVAFLASQGVKAIVVACNSASTVLEPSHFPELPVYGVIKPGAEAALRASTNQQIGVLGTYATIASNAYRSALLAKSKDVTVFQKACPLLVPLVEEGWTDGVVTKTVLEHYLEELISVKIDTLILGCTHYPVLKKVIGEIMGSGVALVDSAEVMSEKLKADIKLGVIERGNSEGGVDIWATDINDTFIKVGQRIMDGIPVKRWSLVDISKKRHYAKL